MWGKETTFLRSLCYRASLCEHSAPIFYYNLVYLECSCWKHFLWIAMPLRGVNSRSVHPLFVRIHWSRIWSPVWLSSLLNFSEEGMLSKYQQILGFLCEIPICATVFIYKSHLFLRYCSQFLFLNILTPVFSRSVFSISCLLKILAFWPSATQSHWKGIWKLCTFPNQVQN